MTDLAPITALGASAPQSRHFGALTISENADLALASLTLRRGASQPVPFGVTLPGPGDWIAGDGISAFWTGPDQWMIEAPGRADEDFAATLRLQAPGCSVTEQTDGWVAFEITSAGGDAPIRALMEKLVNIDTKTFGAGRATRTGLEHMGVFAIRRAADRLAIMGARSAAASLWQALATAVAQMEGMEK